MNQIIAPTMKKLIKEQIEETGNCQFRGSIEDEIYCHFLANPECGHYGEMQLIDMAGRQEFYRCRLPIQMELVW
jgi:hypothetical protein